MSDNNNILVNGDFESTSADEATGAVDHGSWFTAEAIDGWQATEGLIEIQDTPSQGGATPVDPTGILSSGSVLELDSYDYNARCWYANGRDADSTVEQNFTLEENSSFTFGFSYAATCSAKTSDFSITITDADGNVVLFQEFSAKENNLEVAWQRFESELELEAGTYTLSFSSAQYEDRDTVGALIDNVSLVDTGPSAEDDCFTLDLGESEILNVDALMGTETETVAVLDEDFSGTRHLKRLDTVASSDLAAKDGAAFSNACSDGVLLFEPVDVSDLDSSTLSFAIETDGRNRSGFEAADSRYGDTVRVEISVDGGDFILLDLFEVRPEDIGLRGDQQTFIGSLTGQTFSADQATLSYDLPDGASSVQLRFITNLSAYDEIIKFDDVLIEGERTVETGYESGLLANDTDGNGEPLEIISAEGVDLFDYVEQNVTVLEENFDDAGRNLEKLDTVEDSDLRGKNGAARATKRSDGTLEFAEVDIDGLDNETFSFSLNADLLGSQKFESYGWARDFVKVEARFDDGSYQTIDVFDVEWRGGEQVFVGRNSGQEVAVADGFVDLSYDLAALAGAASTAQVRLIAEVTAHGEIFEVDDVRLAGTFTERKGDGIATLTLDSGAIVTIKSDGSFSYNANGKFAYLAEDEQTTDTFTYTVQDASGNTDTATVTIKLVGTNEDPVIGLADDSGAVTEIADGAAGENTTLLSDSGTIAFTDVDLIDTHTVSVATVSATDSQLGVVSARGTLTASVTDPSTGDGGGEVTWTFEVQDSAVDDLAEGQTITQVYTVTVDDGEGGTAAQTVTITITGTNDDPVVATTDLTGAVTEDAATPDLSDSGTIAFADVDLTDSHSIDPVVTASAGALGNLTASVTNQTDANGLGGEITWDYSVANADVQYLAKDQTRVETFTITLDDGNGGEIDRIIEVTITGTNDDPVVATTDLTGAVTEDAATPDLSDSGTIAFADVDLTDSHSIDPVVTASAGALGNLTASVTNQTDANGLGGEITWDYSVANADVQYLAKDQTRVETFTITLDDGNGGEIDRIIEVTITGTNDDPVVATTDLTGAVTEDAATPDLTDSGTIAFTDVDLTDSHSIDPVVTASANALGSLTANVTTQTDASGVSGEVTWNYSVANADVQYLAKGQTKVETFTITLNDGNGGEINRTIEVTIAGTNDDPVVSASIDGGVIEIADGAAGENETVLSDTGTISFADVDLTDGHVANVTGSSATDSATGLSTTVRGEFLVSVPDQSTGDGTGMVTWTFNVEDSAVDDLAAGQVITQVFTVEIDDQNGGTVTEDIAVTITGTNDAPQILAGNEAVIDFDSGQNVVTGTQTLSDGRNVLLGNYSQDDYTVEWSTENYGQNFFADGNSSIVNGAQPNPLFDIDGDGDLEFVAQNDAPTSDSENTFGYFTLSSDDGDLIAVNGFDIVNDDGLNGENGRLNLSGIRSDGVFVYAETLDNGQDDWFISLFDSISSTTLFETSAGTRQDIFDNFHELSSLNVQAHSFGSSSTVRGNGIAIDNLSITSGSGPISETTGEVVELADLSQFENSTVLSASGAIPFADVDLTDGHVPTVTGSSATDSATGLSTAVRGDLLVGVSDPSKGDGTGTVTWIFNVNDSTVDDLAVGQVITQVFTIQIDDQNGGTVSEDITITIVGTNDAPVIGAGTSASIVDFDSGINNIDFLSGPEAAGNYSQDGLTIAWTMSNYGYNYPGGVEVYEPDTAVVPIQDLDSSGENEFGVFDEVQTNEAEYNDGFFNLSADDGSKISINGFDIVNDDGAGGEYGYVNLYGFSGNLFIQAINEDDGLDVWSLEVYDNVNSVSVVQNYSAGYQDVLAALVDLDSLNVQTRSLDFGVGGGFGNGIGIDDVSVTKGSGPVVDLEGEITEGSVLNDSGKIAFTDVDLNDNHSIDPVVVASAGALGSLTASVTTQTDAAGLGGEITWDYSVADAAIQYLAEDETKVETFTITLNDGNGGEIDRIIEVTITGTNDLPVIDTTTSDVAGAVVEDSAATLTDNGTINFVDVDTIDLQAAERTLVSITGDQGSISNAQALTFLTLSGLTSGTALQNGAVDWAFSADNALFDHLSCDEELVFTYEIAISDAIGSDTVQVAVTVTGTNDLPRVSGPVNAGTTHEDASPVQIDLLANASDAEGDNLAIANVSVSSSDGRAVAVQSIDTSTGIITLDPSQFNDLADTEQETLTVTYNVIEEDRAYSDTAAGEELDNAGTFFIADNDTGSIVRIKRSTSVSTYEQALAISGVANGTAVLVDDNSRGLGVSGGTIIDGVFSIGDASSIVSMTNFTGLAEQDPNNVPPTFVFFDGTLSNSTLTITVPREDEACGDATHTYVFTGFEQVTAADQPEFDNLDVTVAPEPVQTSATLIVEGRNDDPDIRLTSPDTADESLTETDSALMVRSTLTYVDADIADTVTATVIGLQTSGDDGSPSLPDAPDLLDMLSIDTDPVLSGVESLARRGWTFDSDAEAFDFLSDGDELVLTYTIEARDSNNATDTQDVIIRILGSNDGPVAVADAFGGDTSTTDDDILADRVTTIEADGVLANDTDADDGAVLTAVAETVTSSLGASVTVNADGSISYDPTSVQALQLLSEGDTTEDTISYTMRDDQGAESTATITFTITGVNNAPEAEDDTVTTDEDTPVTIDVLDNDSDPNGDDLAIQSFTQGSHGTVTLDDKGTADTSDDELVYTANVENFNGSDSFEYTITDGRGETDTATVNVTVDPVNDAPITQPVSADVTENASDFSGFSGSFGAVTIPNSNYFYVVDYAANTVTEVVNTLTGSNFTQANAVANFAPANGLLINVNPNNNNFEIAVVAMTEGVATNVPVSTFDITGGYGGATTTRSAVGFEYFQFLDATTDTDITLSLPNTPTTDGPANVAFTLQGATFTDAFPGDLEIDGFTLDVVAVQGDGEVTVAADFVDPDSGDTHTYSVETTGTTGAVTNNGDGTFTYSTDGQFEYLANGETTTDSFTYTVDDGNGGTDTETVTITVEGFNDAPVTSDIDTGTVSEDDAPETIDLLDGQADPDGDTLTAENVTIKDDEGNSVAFTDNGDGTITIDPDQFGDDLDDGDEREVTISYDVTDGTASTANTATLTVEGVTDNAAPDAVDDTEGGDGSTVNTDSLSSNSRGAAADLGVARLYVGQVFQALGNQIDTIDIGLLAASIGITGNLNFRVLITEVSVNGSSGVGAVLPGDILYESGVQTMPAGADLSGILGAPSFQLATSGVELTPGSQYAVVIDATTDFSVTSGGPFVVSDANVPIGSSLPSFRLDEPSFVGTDRDGHFAQTNWITLPTQSLGLKLGFSNPVTTDENTVASLQITDLLENDTDADGDALTVTAVSGVSDKGAVVTLNGDGTISYDPTTSTTLDALATGDVETDTFTYTISDGKGGTDTATVTVTVAGVNDAPAVIIDQSTVTGSVVELVVPASNGSDTELTAVGTIRISDPDNNTNQDPSVTLVSAKDSDGNNVTARGNLLAGLTDIVTDDGLGTVTWTYAVQDSALNDLSEGENLTQTYRIDLDDGFGGSTPQLITITIAGRNDAPTGISISSNTVGENIPNVAVGVLSAIDPDLTDTHTYTLLPGADEAFFTIVGDELRVGAAGLDFETAPTRTVNVRATDASGQFVDTTVTVNVLDSVESVLTTGSDTITASPANVQISGNINTLNSTDVLDGGTGFDSLVLYGAGNFNLNSVSNYTGFEEVVMVNLANTDVNLTLKDGSSTDVTLVTSGETFTYVNGSTSVGTFIGGDGRDFAYFQGSSTVQNLELGGGSNYIYLYNTATAQNVEMGTSTDFFYAYSDEAWDNTLTVQGESGYDRIYFAEANGTFDATGVTITGVEEFRLDRDNVTVLIDQDTFADSDFRSIYTLRNGTAISTAEATLDLSGINFTGGVSIESTNATGTTFEVSTASVGFLVKGGAGANDTLQTDDFAFTTDERAFIFGTSQLETIIDTSGTYSAPALAPNTFTLTAGTDTPALTSANETVFGNSATLNTTDNLDGGAGTDGLVLYGDGTFNLNTLAGYSNFETLEMVNITNADLNLTLRDGSSTDLTLSTIGQTRTYVNSTTSVGTFIGGDGRDFAYLQGSSIVQNLNLGGGTNYIYLYNTATAQNVEMGTSSDYFYAYSDEAWDNTLTVEGGTGYDRIYFAETNGTFDATGVTITGVEELRLDRDNVTVLVDQDTFADSAFQQFYTIRTGTAISTAEATLDLSGINFTGGVSIESTNATGTTFEVSTASVGFLVKGGAGANDTLQTDDFAFTTDERAFIFGTSQLETIIDTSGTYSAPALAPNTFTLTAGTDTPALTSANETVFGNSATLNTTDNLDGGAGTDGLVLYGDGTFNLNTLAGYSNFETLEMVNITNADLNLTLRDGSSTDLTLSTIGQTRTYVNSTTSVGTFIGGDGRDFAYLQGSSIVQNLNLGGGTNYIYLYNTATAQNVEMGTSSDYFYAYSDEAWDNTLTVEGGTGYDRIYFAETNGTFDATGVTITGVEELRLDRDNVTVLVDQDTFADSAFQQFYTFRNGTAISTAEAALDLSGINFVGGVSIESTNVTGTSFEISTASVGVQIVGGIGIDTISTDDFAFTDTQREFLFNSGSVEIISDTAGIFGDAGANILTALAGGSAMFGNAGDDTLEGGIGNDQMTGGSGNDTFIFNLNGGDDTVNDFNGGAGVSDLLDVSAFGYVDRATALAAGTDDGLGNTGFVLADGSTFTLLGVSKLSLSEDDFLI